MPIDPSLIARWEAQLGSGLRDNYDLTILSATFGTDAAYQNGMQTLLIITGIDENDDPVQEMFSVGAGWESLDGGFHLSPTSGAKSINRNSMYGHFCTFAGLACIAADIDYVFDKSNLDASMWNGTRWHMREQFVAKGFRDRTTNEMRPDLYRVMPEAWLGFDGEVPVVAPVASDVGVSARRAALQARVAQAASSAPPTSPNGTHAELASLAVSSPDFSTFLNAALNLDSVVTDDELATQVVDSSPSGYYATHHG